MYSVFHREIIEGRAGSSQPLLQRVIESTFSQREKLQNSARDHRAANDNSNIEILMGNKNRIHPLSMPEAETTLNKTKTEIRN
jgi:hypothetical protein